MTTQPCTWNWIAQLSTDGFAVVAGLATPALSADLYSEAVALHRSGALTRAGVGRADDHALDRDIRRDRTLWIDRGTGPRAAYFDLLERVRAELNRALFLGLFAYEAHYAVYEPGGFYIRHVDAFRGARNRVLSTVLYLNPDWRAGDGGDLAIYAPDAPENAEPVALIAPEAGVMALFLSEEIPHEVRPTRRDRYSIAGWFRVNDRLGAPSLQAPAIAE